MDLYEDTSLSKILGINVKIVLINNEEITGQVYSYIKEKNLLISKKYLYLNLVIKQKLNKINDIPEIKGSTSFKSQTNTPIQTNDVYGIRITKIKEIHPISNSQESLEEEVQLPYIQGNTINLDKLLEKERMSIEKKVLLKRSDKSNLLYKTYLKGYLIYEKLSKIFNIRFTGTNIKFEELDAYIDVPFNLKDIHCDNEKAKEHLTKLIEQCIKDVK